MPPLDERLVANRANWNDRVPIHVSSDSYAVARFVADPDELSDVVTFDWNEIGPFVGDVKGKSLAHPQCHFGRDTLSWARLGARVTGLDFSPSAITAARAFATQCGVADARFVEGDVHDAPSVLRGETFNLVYTGVGALNWLPSVERWAESVAALVAPGGWFYIREGHPVLWAVSAPEHDGQLLLRNAYFEMPDPYVADEVGTYAGTGSIVNTRTYEWNHGIAETVMALLGQGLKLVFLREYDFCPWQALPQMVTDDDERWRLAERPERLPLMYSVLCRRP